MLEPEISLVVMMARMTETRPHMKRLVARHRICSMVSEMESFFWGGTDSSVIFFSSSFSMITISSLLFTSAASILPDFFLEKTPLKPSKIPVGLISNKIHACISQGRRKGIITKIPQLFKSAES